MVHKKMKGISIILLSCIFISVMFFTNCPPGDLAAPTNLTVTSSFPCAISWTDNTDVEDGYRIYIGTSCADCTAVSNWILVDTVSANTTSYEWPSGASCCNVAECSCVQVRAYNSDGEAACDAVMLAPLCK